MHAGVADLFQKAGRADLAQSVRQRAVAVGIWDSEDHTPPVFNKQMRSKAVPKPGMFPAVEKYITVLNTRWKEVLQEYRDTLDLHTEHDEGLHRGSWSILELGAPGTGNCEERTPFLCSLIAEVEKENVKDKVWVQTLRFSRLGANAHIEPHTSRDNQRLKVLPDRFHTSKTTYSGLALIRTPHVRFI